MEISDCAHYALLLSSLLKWNIWLRSLRCFSLVTALTTLFYFTIVKWKSLTTLTTLFYFHHYQNEIFDYADYAVFLHWLRSLSCLSSLLLNGNLWLRSLYCFTFTTIKINHLTTLTTLFSSLTTLTVLPFFSTIKWRSLTALTTLFYFYHY